MFLENYFNCNINAKQYAKESYTFSTGYDYWKEILFERTVRLFIWKNTGEVPTKEIETILMLNGTAGFTKAYKNELTVFNGQFAGQPTKYYDEFKQYSVYSPVFSSILNVGKNVVVMSNNALRNSLMPLVHRYAIMLSHVEVSFVNALINGRDSGGIPIASTQAQKESIESYRNSLCNGKVTSILDPAFSGVQFIGIDKNTTLSVKELLECRQNLLSSYYSDIGVKTAREKKGNMITEEVNANDSMLMLNLSDMLYERKLGVDAINKMFNVNWSVELAKELQYEERNINDDNKGIVENNKGTE